MTKTPSLLSSIFTKTARSMEAAWAWLANPNSSLNDPGDRRRAQLMMALALTIALSVLGPVLMSQRDSASRNAILNGLSLISFISYLLGRTRFYKWGSILLVFGTAAAGFGLVLSDQANNASNALHTTLPLVLVIGSALLSLPGLFFLTLFCGFGPMFLPLFSDRVSYADGMLRDGGIFLVLGILLIGITVFRNKLEKTRLEELHTANQSLQAIQSTLEERVAERTAAAETARSQAESDRNQAEAARQEVESGMWLATGQTQLADTIRGEQTIAQLAENVISQLCRYTGAQAGALFLLNKKTLTLAGRYAFGERPGFDGSFKLGEGLVGQAAADGKVLYLGDIPSETLVISTGLVDLKPRQIVAAPFYMNEKVVGVLELATLSEFTQTHLELWNRISENLGSAFYTMQTRQRLAEALAESQQQAEELQAQEEELRASNEELQAQSEELQAKEEELRTTNEELQTQAEELQKRDEELRAANEELQTQAEQIKIIRETNIER